MKRSTKDKSGSEQKEGSHSNGNDSPNSDTDSENSQRICLTNTSPEANINMEFPDTEQDNEVGPLNNILKGY
jgi:hypothetical protein